MQHIQVQRCLTTLNSTALEMAYLGPTDLLEILGTDPSAEETSQHKECYHSQIALGN